MLGALRHQASPVDQAVLVQEAWSPAATAGVQIVCEAGGAAWATFDFVGLAFAAFAEVVTVVVVSEFGVVAVFSFAATASALSYAYHLVEAYHPC